MSDKRFEMNEDLLDELLERCQSPIERELLNNLYPHLPASRVHELRAQYKIDGYDDMPLTLPDFAFPDMQIVIYCDGFASREGDRAAFRRDRLQSRELQLRGWIVLRFAGNEINYNSEMVVDTIERAIERRTRQRAWRSQQQQPSPVRQRETPALQESPAQYTPSPQRTPPSRQAQPSQQQESPAQQTPAPQRTPPTQQAQPKPQAQQKPKGGLCGVIALACVVVGILVLLDFIY